MSSAKTRPAKHKVRTFRLNRDLSVAKHQHVLSVRIEQTQTYDGRKHVGQTLRLHTAAILFILRAGHYATSTYRSRIHECFRQDNTVGHLEEAYSTLIDLGVLFTFLYCRQPPNDLNRLFRGVVLWWGRGDVVWRPALTNRHNFLPSVPTTAFTSLYLSA